MRGQTSSAPFLKKDVAQVCTTDPVEEGNLREGAVNTCNEVPRILASLEEAVAKVQSGLEPGLPSGA